MQSSRYPNLSSNELEEMVVRNYTGQGSKKKQWSIRDIADKLGVPYEAVRRVLRSNEVELRGRGKRARVIDPETTKRTCRVCHWKTVVKNFVKDKTHAGGYGYVCNDCNRKRLRTSV
jgi:superfamily II helicase